MRVAERLETRWTEVRSIARIVPALLPIRPGSHWSISQQLAERAASHPEEVGIAYADRRLRWREIDREASRAANALWASGVRPGDAVALLMDNRPQFAIAASAISRVRGIGALINTNVTGKALAHALRVSKAARVLVGSEHAEKLAAALPEVEGLAAERVLESDDPEADGAPRFARFEELAAEQPDTPPPVPGKTGVEDPAFYIYTSGTTGLPKAAIISGRRLVSAGAMLGRGVFDLSPGDVHYVPLPLYHSAGFFGGWTSALLSGCCMAFRRRFSASGFLHDVRAFDATSFIYIGELCRYLLNTPEKADDRRNPLRIAGGNGLRPDVWEPFQKRFGVPLIREYYGATEGATPLVNFSGKPGMVGRMMPGTALVRCDLETGEILRNAAGYCDRVATGGTGLLLSRLAGKANFDGYVDPEATRKKILHDVFKRGDRYFNSGDLLSLHEDGWIDFADRVGDTFRWKGENVSTTEVAEILNGAPGVEESNVYGVQVPGSEGRAGMVSLHCTDTFSIDAFAAFVVEQLPGYQRPYFLRIQKGMRITGTFKHQKVDYQREGYDPSLVTDPLYLLEGDKYVPLDGELYQAIQSQRVTLR
jgi:acyl-CoA synthetase (AMP-forming)/AMP-acid ligase II